MKYLSSIIIIAALLLNSFSCNVINQTIDDVVDFAGIFETDQGWLVELINNDGKIISLQSNPYPSYRKVGDYMIMSATRTGDNTWGASVRAHDGFFEWVDDIKIEDDQLTFSTGGIPRVWKKYRGSDQPGNNDDEEDDDEEDEGPQNPDGVSAVVLGSNLNGTQDSKKTFSFTVPSGTKKLEVTLEEDNDGRQLADMFVKRGSSPSVTRNNYANRGWTADCASIRPNRDTEECVFTNPSSGTWYVMVYGFHAYDGATLRVRFTK